MLWHYLRFAVAIGVLGRDGPGPSAADPGSRYIPYTPDNETRHDAAEDQPWLSFPARGAGMDVEMTPGVALEDVWI
jgi:hypothetical protein